MHTAKTLFSVGGMIVDREKYDAWKHDMMAKIAKEHEERMDKITLRSNEESTEHACTEITQLNDKLKRTSVQRYRVKETDNIEDLYSTIVATEYQRSPYYRHALIDNPAIQNHLPEDDCHLEAAAVSLGMGCRMLPSNRYS